MASPSRIVVTQNLVKRFSAFAHGLDAKTLKQVVRRSIQRTLTGVRAKAPPMFKSRKLINLSASEMKRRIRTYDETRGKSIAGMYGKIWFTPKPESLGRFYAKRVKAGKSQHVGSQGKGGWRGVQLYTVRVNALGSPYLVDGRTFMVQKGKNPAVFARMANTRLPIKKLYGLSVAEITRRYGIHTQLAHVASERYQTEFTANAQYYVERAIQRAISVK